MKKNILIILFIALLIISFLLVFNKFYLNKNEKELLSVLNEFNTSLQNIEPKENDNYNFRPSEVTSLKQYVSNIYEARKYIAENGAIFFLFRVELVNESGNSNNILIISNGNMISRTINETTYKYLNISTNDFTNSLQKVFFEKVNNITLERWDKSEIINNVNFEKILNKI